MRSRPTIRLAVLLAAIVAAAPALARPAADFRAVQPALAPWEAVAASGAVQARSAGAEQAVWRDVSRGDELMPQTVVQTGRKGRATLTRNASLLILDPHSRVELPGEGFSPMDTSVIQTDGSVLYKVDSRANPHFEVVTPYLVAGVKGTSFLVTVNDRYASVTVRHGLVEVTNPATGESVELGPGESVLRDRDDLEMDLVRDMRRSRDARKESRRMDRMDRRTGTDEQARQPEVDLAQASDDGAAADADRRVAVDDPEGDDTLSWADDSVHGAAAAPDATVLNVDEITKEIIEEMIREGIESGIITEPTNDVPLPAPGSSGIPTDPGVNPNDPGNTPQ